MSSELIFFTVVGIGVIGFFMLVYTRRPKGNDLIVLERIVAKQLSDYDANIRGFRDGPIIKRITSLEQSVGILQNLVRGLVAYTATDKAVPDKERKRGRAQEEIIAYLQAKNSCTASDVVREFGYTKPTVLKVADKLVKSGMIEKSYVKGRLVLTLKKEEGSHE